MRAYYKRLDPVVILRELERLQDRFWEHAHRKGTPVTGIKVAGELIAQNPNPPLNLIIIPPEPVAEIAAETLNAKA